MFAWLFGPRITSLDIAVEKDNLSTQIANLEYQRSQASTAIHTLLPATAPDTVLTRSQAHSVVLLHKRIAHIDACIVAIQDALDCIETRERSAETVEALDAANNLLKEMQRGDDETKRTLEEFEEVKGRTKEMSTFFGGSGLEDAEKDEDVNRAFAEMDREMEEMEGWDKDEKQTWDSERVRVFRRKVSGQNGPTVCGQRIEQSMAMDQW